MQPERASVKPTGSETIEALFAALESPLLAYALRLAGDRATAEDLVQDAFMKLHAQFAEIREPRRWLYRAVHNAALNHRRDSGKLVPFDPPPAADAPDTAETADTEPLPDEMIARWENIGLVRLGLETLDARSRELIRLKFHDNLSYKEIAARTGLTASHVGYLLHHALKGIAGELARKGVEP
ncbi:MAG: RNA polymerase sigma factor [Verrucomicrobia bacterium]|nr:RNA polymerase sigma factor [Verrucomicrobiota bacterium]